MKISAEVFRMVRRTNSKDFLFLVRTSSFFQILNDSGIDELNWMKAAIGSNFNLVVFSVLKDYNNSIDIVIHEGFVHSVIDRVKYKLHKDLMESYIHRICKDLLQMNNNCQSRCCGCLR